MRIREPGRSLLVSVNSLLSSAWRPGERTSAKHMGMHVSYSLPAVAARAENDPVTGRLDALGGGDLASRGDQFAEQSVARAGKRGDMGEMIPWNHQDVRRRLGVNVAEGHDPLPVQHDRGRDLSGSDPAEQAFRHTTIIVARPLRTVPSA